MLLVTCEGPGCGVEFEAARPTARYHDATCRSRARRARAVGPAAVAVKTPAGEHAFVTATRKELVELEALESMLGQQVLTIAERMGRGAETGSAMAALSKEHSRLIDEIRSRTKGKAGDPVEMARSSRATKAARASSR